MIAEGCRVTAIGAGRPARVALDGGRAVLADDVVVATAGYTPSLGLLGMMLAIPIFSLVVSAWLFPLACRDIIRDRGAATT